MRTDQAGQEVINLKRHDKVRNRYIYMREEKNTDWFNGTSSKKTK